MWQVLNATKRARDEKHEVTVAAMRNTDRGFPRTLREVFFPLRLEKSAQWEIRALANEMLRLVKPLAPVIFESFEVEEDIAKGI